VADHSVALGDHVHDLHPEVRERLGERPDPALGLLGDPAARDLGHALEVALVDGVDEAADQLLVAL
jgi:hypothetical protein